MIMMFLKYQFAGIWPLLWHFGLGGVLVIGLLAAAYFSPVFKKDFLWAAALVVVIIISTAIGVTLGERRIQAQWDQASANAVENAKEARTGAIADVARKPHRWLPNKSDRFNRDGK